jgi:Ca2+-binding RTX toxin-like protein
VAGDDVLEGGDGPDGLVGDANAFTGAAAGAGDDVLRGGAGNDFLRGDSESPSQASGSGGADILDVGPDGGAAVGDHNTGAPGSSATGAGDDRIIGGSANEQFLVGDSSADNVTDAGNDAIDGEGGTDSLFGDNIGAQVLQTVGTVGGADELRGGDADDTLRAGPGDDSLDGGRHTTADDCDGEAGAGDKAKRCEVVAGIP